MTLESREKSLRGVPLKKKRGEGFKEQWLRDLEQVKKKLGELEKEL